MSQTVYQAQKYRTEMLVASTGDRVKNIMKENKKRKITPYRGQVWTCDFGQNVGGEINGIRPCLVIQYNDANRLSRNTIVLPLDTSNDYPGAIYVPLEEGDVISLGGYLKGYVIVDQVQVISKARLGRRIAKLSDNAMNKIGEAMRKVLDV
ncbi:type II toxin-antitoxin system PemK/MazF family toxin [Brevibacillus sp. NPDC058079]|uniref:type II toxin-antitoxin system PemK/MazF family toxin n=1 Tax=Brevibacillus sp. NPDC058079 TaxID=3346330 RepID=UPI0036E9F05B